MSTIKNSQGISLITFSANVRCFCPMGNDYYTNQFDVSFVPDEFIPDYCDIDEFLDGMNDAQLIIEDAVNSVFEYMKNTYFPIHLEVSSTVTDAVHLPVTVTKTL